MGSLKKHLEEFEKSLLEEMNDIKTSNKLQEHIDNFDKSLDSKPDVKFESNNNEISGLKNIHEQHQEELEQKDRIIKNLKQEIKSQWLTNKTAFNTKKLYEDKIKEMEVIDPTNLIPTLVEVSKQKQGSRILDWNNWLKIPESNYLFQINQSLAKKVFQEANGLLQSKLNNQRRIRGSGTVNYFLSFTGDTETTARADLVRTDFTPNDPTNKGFAEGSGRIPLAKSGFTISYWYRPDEHTNNAFAMGWKYDGNSRFSFGMRNAARPYFSIGSNQFGTYGGHNSWVTMTQNSGFIDNYNIDDYLDGDSNLRLNKWYHIVVTYVGQEPGGVANNETEQIRRIYLDGYQIYGQKDEAIGTDYNDWHNVDRRGEISWPEGNQDARMSRGFSFGMRALKGTGTIVASDGESIHKSKYNNGHACGLDDVAIYNELKDNDWVRSVYNGGTKYNHTGGDNLVAYWKFNEGSGTTVKDLGPYGYHGTLTNAAVGEGDDITVQDAIRSISSGTPTWNDMSEENR